MENGNISQGEGKDPSSFLSDIIGNPVTVKLNSGVVYKGERLSLSLITARSMEVNSSDFGWLTPKAGELQSVDGYMNIALEKTEEYVNGVKRRAYGDAFVRGNNVMYISADS
ncbi:U6 snRNA-associated sm-like protein LSM6 [Colletotrichum musicola]|uniref:U6 snRNA-associated Sm-like protein LSm6 n=1 Tax=Colletotrichum musicola TaxID=2175873 RepID=A0A8H6NVR3_9PEZI|nr:U6 snRNA-associated sm-like protein LSM6 [Colletotrichum musicola]